MLNFLRGMNSNYRLLKMLVSLFFIDATALRLTDFVAELEVKIPADHKGFNSGLGFRLIDDKGKSKGYQCEIDRTKPASVYGPPNWVHVSLWWTFAANRLNTLENTITTPTPCMVNSLRY